jgi:hypothetical protein
MHWIGLGGLDRIGGVILRRMIGEALRIEWLLEYWQIYLSHAIDALFYSYV